MPNLDLIRLHPPYADAEMLSLIVWQPANVAGMCGMGALALLCLLPSSWQMMARWSAIALGAAHLAEALELAPHLRKC